MTLIVVVVVACACGFVVASRVLHVVLVVDIGVVAAAARAGSGRATGRVSSAQHPHSLLLAARGPQVS